MAEEKLQFSIYLPKELNKRLEQLATKNVRSKNEQVVFILKEALKNYDAFLECVSEAKIMGHPVKLDSDLNEDEWHVQSEIKE